MHNIKDIENYLRAHSDARAVVIWQKFGLQTKDEFLGVGLTNLKNYAKQLKKNQETAIALWQLPVHDAKLLACFLMEPKFLSKTEILNHLQDIQSTDLADKYGAEVLAPSQHLSSLMQEIPWQAEMMKRTFLSAIGAYAKLKSKTKDVELLNATLSKIELEFNTETNWVRDAMNNALIAIGKGEPSLKPKALEIATSLWPFTIDYGDTSCITLNPIKYLSSQ